MLAGHRGISYTCQSGQLRLEPIGQIAEPCTDGLQQREREAFGWFLTLDVPTEDLGKAPQVSVRCTLLRPRSQMGRVGCPCPLTKAGRGDRYRSKRYKVFIVSCPPNSVLSQSIQNWPAESKMLVIHRVIKRVTAANRRHGDGKAKWECSTVKNSLKMRCLHSGT